MHATTYLSSFEKTKNVSSISNETKSQQNCKLNKLYAVNCSGDDLKLNDNNKFESYTSFDYLNSDNQSTSNKKKSYNKHSESVDSNPKNFNLNDSKNAQVNNKKKLSNFNSDTNRKKLLDWLEQTQSKREANNQMVFSKWFDRINNNKYKSHLFHKQYPENYTSNIIEQINLNQEISNQLTPFNMITQPTLLLNNSVNVLENNKDLGMHPLVMAPPLNLFQNSNNTSVFTINQANSVSFSEIQNKTCNDLYLTPNTCGQNEIECNNNNNKDFSNCTKNSNEFSNVSCSSVKATSTKNLKTNDSIITNSFVHQSNQSKTPFMYNSYNNFIYTYYYPLVPLNQNEPVLYGCNNLFTPYQLNSLMTPKINLQQQTNISIENQNQIEPNFNYSYPAFMYFIPNYDNQNNYFQSNSSTFTPISDTNECEIFNSLVSSNQPNVSLASNN